jgi:hypothetical protein
MSEKVLLVTSFINSVTALAKASHLDEGAVVNSTRAITRLTSSPADPQTLLDPDLQEACQRLTTAAMSQGSEIPKKEHASKKPKPEKKHRGRHEPDVSKIIDVLESFTTLAQADHGDSGALSGVKSSITALQDDDPEFVDDGFIEASNNLASVLVSRVSVASLDDPDNPPSIASGMAHTGETAYRRASDPDPATGSSPKDSAGDALPENVHTQKHPQKTKPGPGNAGTGAQPGDTTMTGSGLSA